MKGLIHAGGGERSDRYRRAIRASLGAPFHLCADLVGWGGGLKRGPTDMKGKERGYNVTEERKTRPVRAEKVKKACRQEHKVLYIQVNPAKNPAKEPSC